ncbi:Vacuolar ATPase assembly integral membrane protein VMA21-like domain [Euphorbia peplus]|nr:Vacuolar ATPase assembly integral membrane protein VMA21-like domain [Euphorbia peplus]
MAAVIMKFFITSMFMWIAPIAILYAFNNDLFPGITHLSPESLTLFSGFLAVISVNIVIAFYIYMAMKEPSGKREPEPDPKFLSEAKASVSQFVGKTEDSSSQASKKEE